MAVKEELLGFVKEALGRGHARHELETVLQRAGWPADQVTKALGGFADVAFPIPVPRPKPYLSAREAFQYLVLFSTLYLSSWNLGSLLFHWRPDDARLQRARRRADDPFRSQGAHGRRDRGNRVHLLPFRSAQSGAGGTGGPVMNAPKAGSNARRIVSTLAIAAVASVVAASLSILGSPKEARARRLDEGRAGDLRDLSNAIEQHFDHDGSSPAGANREWLRSVSVRLHARGHPASASIPERAPQRSSCDPAPGWVTLTP